MKSSKTKRQLSYYLHLWFQPVCLVCLVFFFARRIFFMLFHVFCVHSWSSWASRSCTCGWPIWTRRWSAKFWNCAGATRRNGGPSSTPWTRSASGNKTFEEQSNQQQQQQQPCATTRKRRQEDENWGGRGSKTSPKEKKTSQPNIVSGAFGFPFLFFLSYFLFFCSLFFVCVVIYVVGCRQRLISRRFDSGRRRNATGRPGHAVRSRGARFTLVSRSFRFSSTFVSSPRRTFVCVSRFRVVFLLLNLFFFSKWFSCFSFFVVVVVFNADSACKVRPSCEETGFEFGTFWIGLDRVSCGVLLEVGRKPSARRHTQKKGNN